MLKCVYKPQELCGGNLECGAECFKEDKLKRYMEDESYDSSTIELVSKIRDKFIKDYYATIDNLE